VQCPNPEDLKGYCRWLLDYGAQHPGLYLYPTSDDLCWIIAKYKDQLQKYYVISYPDLAVIKSLLDKRSLYQAAIKVGLMTPESRDPQDLVNGQALTLRYPVILKPRSQVGMRSKVKGIIINSEKELPRKISEFRQRVVYDSEVLTDIPDLNEPLVQRFYENARFDTYSIAGFVSKDRHVFLTRASSKVLQNPPMIGVGICFEGREVEPEIQNKLKELCELLGYYGIFEAEFIKHVVHGESQYLLMDFNPRYYGQMEFEIRRQLPLPLLPFAEMQSDQKLWSTLVEQQPQSLKEHASVNFRHVIMLRLLLTTQFIGFRLSWEDWKKWMKWSFRPAFDPIVHRHDKMPLWIDLGNLLLRFLKHPRSTLKHFFR
jgi:predicted ATP-grasp superfamily ATP-dependent carboligase